MKLEHVAFNVEDALSMARWYVDHLGLCVKRRVMESPWAHFLADDSGAVMLEIYSNPDVPVPDYRNTDPLVVHNAFVSKDIAADLGRLIAAGATQYGETLKTPAGDTLAMLRDPWGLAIQLVHRNTPMV